MTGTMPLYLTSGADQVEWNRHYTLTVSVAAAGHFHRHDGQTHKLSYS